MDFQSVKEVELPREDTEQQDAKYDPDGASAGSPANRAAVRYSECSRDGEEDDAVCFCDSAL